MTIEKLKKALSKEGLRYTQQRQAVWDELCSNDEHRDAEEIYLSLKKNGLQASRATVYRTIDVLVKNDLVRKLELGDGKARYENKVDSKKRTGTFKTFCSNFSINPFVVIIYIFSQRCLLYIC